MPANMTLGFRQRCDSRTEEAGSDYHPFNHNRLRRLADTETDRMRKALEPTQDSNWILTHEGYNVLSESAVESRLAFGNGFLESVRKHHLGLHSFRSMRRIDASLRKVSALRLRHSQSLASLRHLPSQAKVRSTIQRLGKTTKRWA